MGRAKDGSVPASFPSVVPTPATLPLPSVVIRHMCAGIRKREICLLHTRSSGSQRVFLEEVIRAKSRDEVSLNRKEREGSRQELTRIQRERDALLDMMLKGHIEAEMYKRKDKELLLLANHLKVRLEGQEWNQSEIGDTAIKLLELSQTLKSKWLVADIPEKRALLEIVCLNLTFENASLIMTMRKPFDMFAEGLQMKIGTGGWN